MIAEILDQFRQQMVDDLNEAFGDARNDMVQAIHKLADEREDPEKPLVFSCSFGAKLDLEKNKVATSFSFNVKTTVKNETVLGDPNQTRMEFDAD